MARRIALGRRTVVTSVSGNDCQNDDECTCQADTDFMHRDELQDTVHIFAPKVDAGMPALAEA